MLREIERRSYINGTMASSIYGRARRSYALKGCRTRSGAMGSVYGYSIEFYSFLILFNLLLEH